MLGLVRRRERRGRREDRAKRGSADRQGAAAPRALWGRLALRGAGPPHGAASRSRAVPSPTSAHFCSAPRSCQSGWICREGKPVCSPQTTKPFSSCAVCSCLITPCHFGTGPLLLSRSLGEDFRRRKICSCCENHRKLSTPLPRLAKEQEEGSCGAKQPVTGQGMAHPSLWSSQALGWAVPQYLCQLSTSSSSVLTARLVLFPQDRSLSLWSLPTYCSQRDGENTGVLACAMLSPML